MKRIKYNEYNIDMGKLINVNHPLDYIKDNISTNIYYEKLIYNPSKYLDKKTKYYITCNKGKLSQKVVTTLEFYGYNVTQVVK